MTENLGDRIRRRRDAKLNAHASARQHADDALDAAKTYVDTMIAALVEKNGLMPP